MPNNEFEDESANGASSVSLAGLNSPTFAKSFSSLRLCVKLPELDKN
jgi:hypothetical protein